MKINKKLLIATMSSLAIICGVYLTSKIKSNKVEETQLEIVIESELETEKEIIKENNNKILNNTLIDKHSIIPKENPLLYDYFNGSLNYTTNIKNIDDFSIFYALLVDEGFNEFWISKYNIAELLVFPIFGTEPKSFELNDIEKQRLKENLENISKNRKFKDLNPDSKGNNWTMYIISQYNSHQKDEEGYVKEDATISEEYAGINLEGLISNEFGSAYTDIVLNKEGWPLEWLQKEPYKTLIEDKTMYDLDDNIWTSGKWKVEEKHTYKLNGETIEVSALNDFSGLLVLPDGSYNELLWEQIENKINDEGWKEE